MRTALNTMAWSDRTFKLIFACCFAIGSANHALDILRGGLLPYRAVPTPINAFWTLLCPVDAALAILVWKFEREAIAIGIGVLLADVTVNSWIAYFSGLHLQSFEPLQVQTLVLGFVLGGGLFSLRREDAKH
jgi:hypothetical protein